MRSIYFGSLKVHDSVSATDFWVHSPIEGLDAPDMRMNVLDRPGEDGAVVTSSFYSSRTVIFTGTINGSSIAAHETNRQTFAAAVATQKDSYGYPTPVRITLTTVGGSTYYLDAYFKKPVFAYDSMRFSNYMVEAVISDPYIYSSTTSSTSISPPVGGGAVVPFIVPVTLAAGSGGAASVTNSGNATSYPVLTLTGQLTNPYIYNAAVNKYLQLTYTISAPDIVTINMKQKTILLNGSSSLLSTKTVGSEWWGIISGTNNLSFSTGSTADTGTLAISYNAAYLGL